MRRFLLITSALAVFSGCRTADPPLQNPSPPPDVPTQPGPPVQRAPGTPPPVIDQEERASNPPPDPVPPKGEVVGGEATTQPRQEQEGERPHHGETLYPDGTVVDPIPEEPQ